MALKRVVFCNGGQCCPVGTQLSDGRIELKDDFGMSVTMSKKEFRLLLEPEQEKTLSKTGDGKFYRIYDSFMHPMDVYVRITPGHLSVIRELGYDLLEK